MADVHCVICDGRLTGRQQRFCSKACAIKGNTIDRKSSGRLAAQIAKHKQTRAAWMNANRHRYRTPYRYMETVQCHVCRAPFKRDTDVAIAGRTKHCSEACYLVLMARRRRRHAVRLKLRKAAAGSRGGWLFVAGPCSHCGRSCTVRTNQLNRANYCSERCTKAAARSIRRARKRGAVVEPFSRVDVFKRDGWSCRLCSSPIDPRSVAPEPWSPTVDHIIPLAKGGAHSLENCQAAHFICNAIKSDRLFVGGDLYAERTGTTAEGPIAAGAYQLRPDPARHVGPEEGASAFVGEAA